MTSCHAEHGSVDPVRFVIFVSLSPRSSYWRRLASQARQAGRIGRPADLCSRTTSIILTTLGREHTLVCPGGLGCWQRFENPKQGKSIAMDTPLDPDLLLKMDAYWRAANYLSVGQIYLLDNPLLTEPLALEHVKPRLLGHWGTTPGQNFVYVHLNRIIKKYDLNLLYISGPGHGGPALVANTYLEGTYSEFYPNITKDAAGLKRLFKQFSFPGGIPSHVAPETPGSIHEGGELGYSLSHAFGAVFDNPHLIVACVVGDGEAETGPLATSWHGNKFLNPAADGAVLKSRTERSPRRRCTVDLVEVITRQIPLLSR